MRGKIAFVAGAALGYVLGTRAGRERYEQIKAGAIKVWNSPPVRAASDAVGDVLGKQAEKAQNLLAEGIKKLVDATIGKPSSSRARSTPIDRTPVSADTSSDPEGGKP